MSRRKRYNPLPLALLALTWLIFFSRTLFLKQLYFLDDLKIIYYPLEYVYAQFQGAWQLPVWSELFGFGHPLLAWGQLGFFTPVHVLLRLLGIHPLILLQASILIYFALGLVGMFVFLRQRRLHPVAASLGAIVFVFSGFNIGHLNHVNFYVATMVLPWLLVAIDAFVTKPTARRAALMALVAAVIPLSGQPQISLYVLSAAAIYGLVRVTSTRIKPGGVAQATWLFKLTNLTILAGLLSFSLASLAVLPLLEFLPNTERAHGLSQTELLDFSYPPEHAITLLFPYYFGDHERYWGAKSFQELSAYVGIVPLLLAGAALTSWKKYRAERTVGILFIALGITFALGVNSPLYRYLIEDRIITTLGIPGRFVFFFDIGIALLAAIGLADFVTKRRSFKKSVLALLAGVIFPTLLLLPTIALWPDAWAKFPTTSGLLAAGLLVFLVGYFYNSQSSVKRAHTYLLIILSAITLLAAGWNNNPLQTSKIALTPSPFTQTLRQFSAEQGIPARVYATQLSPLIGITERLSQSTEPISPLFTVYQPFTLHEGINCLSFPAQTDNNQTGTVEVAIRLSLTDPPLVEKTISTEDIAVENNQYICLPQELVLTAPRQLVFSANSGQNSNIKLFYSATKQKSVYFVRVADPSAEQLARSQKNGRLILKQELAATADADAALLMRHMQVTGNASSARWIGALSIASYRAFTENFFADDRQPFNREGQHALTHNRKLVNMSGITHLTQALPHEDSFDSVVQSNYQLAAEAPINDQRIRLYRNPNAYPKAFLVPNAIFEPNQDVVHHEMSLPNYEPSQLIYVNGPKPPADLPSLQSRISSGTAVITTYQPTSVDIAVTTPEDAWLVLTDSWTPQWHTYLDDRQQAPLVANTLWRTVRVPQGQHIVSFRYHSPAIEQAKKLTIASLLITLTLILLPSFKNTDKEGVTNARPTAAHPLAQTDS